MADTKGIWKSLYSTLTTSQIEKALRQGGFTHQDWLEFTGEMQPQVEQPQVEQPQVQLGQKTIHLGKENVTRMKEMVDAARAVQSDEVDCAICNDNESPYICSGHAAWYTDNPDVVPLSVRKPQ